MITGQKSTRTGDFEKQIGIAEFNLVSFNPSREELEDLLGTEIKEDPEYLGESKDGNVTLQVDVWLKEVKTKRLFKAKFFLEDREVHSKDGLKKQYINCIGRNAYVEDEDKLTEKFKAYDYHTARVGEADFVSLVDAWLNLERSKPYTLDLDWKNMMKGNLRELKELQKTDLPRAICGLCTVRVVEKEGEKKEYQSIYTRKFLPYYTMKNFVSTDFTEDKLSQLKAKRGSVVGDKKVYLKDWENFAVEVSDKEHGCKDIYTLQPMQDYDPSKFVQAGPKAIVETDSDY